MQDLELHPPQPRLKVHYPGAKIMQGWVNYGVVTIKHEHLYICFFFVDADAGIPANTAMNGSRLV